MRNFKRFTFVLLTVVLLGLVGCAKKGTDLKPIKTIIEDIGVVYNLDTEWQSYNFVSVGVQGNSSFVMFDEGNRSLTAVYVSNGKIAMIEIWYDTKLFTNDIDIDDLTIQYADIKAQISIEVNFWEDGNTSTFDSLEQLVDYLNTFSISDVYNLLYDLEYIRK